MMTTTRRVLVLQHVPWETPGRVLPALAAVGVAAETRHLLSEGNTPAPLPALDELAGVVILGGPMGADDVLDHPALAAERDLAARAVGADIPVLGICLGHQILALALGGALEPGTVQEIGVAPITLLAESPLGRPGSALDVLHWHFDNAVPPSGAEVLARTEGCPNQAFRMGSGLGLQFHLEVDPPLLTQWLAMPEVRAETTVSPELLLAGVNVADARMHSAASAVFGEFAASTAART